MKSDIRRFTCSILYRKILDWSLQNGFITSIIFISFLYISFSLCSFSVRFVMDNGELIICFGWWFNRTKCNNNTLKSKQIFRWSEKYIRQSTINGTRSEQCPNLGDLTQARAHCSYPLYILYNFRRMIWRKFDFYSH